MKFSVDFLAPLALCCFLTVQIQSIVAVPVLSCAYDFVIGFISDRIIASNPVVKNFNGTLMKIIEQFDREMNNTDIQDQAAIEALYHRIAIEHLKELRKETKKVSDYEKYLADLDAELKEHAERLRKCTEGADGDMFDIEKQTEKEEEEELMLIEEHKKIEVEMGAGLSEENRKALEARARDLLRDLLQNEVRQLALSAVVSYTTGGPMRSVMNSIGNRIKTKLVHFFLHAILDLFGAALGRKIVVHPAMEADFTTTEAYMFDPILFNR